MKRPQPIHKALPPPLAAALLGATAILAGCGGSSGETDPLPDQKKAQIAKARKQLREARRTAVKQTTSLRESSRIASGFLATLPGRSGLVVAPVGVNGPRVSGGNLASGPAWSTIKVPIAQRVLTDAGSPSELSPDQERQITAALTLSDNDAAAALFTGLVKTYGSVTGGSEAVGEMLGEAGDTKTIISSEGRESFSTYGQTDWNLFEQNKYMSALAGGCLTTEASTRYLLGQMSKVTSDTWGLGSVGAPARWKGGWGPGIDGKYLVRQMGVVDLPERAPMVITLAAIPDDGSFETGQAIATEIARWTVENLAGEPKKPSSCGTVTAP